MTEIGPLATLTRLADPTPDDGRDIRTAAVFAGRSRRVFAVGFLAWGGLAVTFWLWWLRPEHVVDLPRFIAVSFVLAWVTLQPLYFMAIFSGARRPHGPLALPPGSRVAMVVTKAPSEPFAIVAETLEAMLAQDYPHDTWLADEDPTAETVAWCLERGVLISTRHGRADYHRPQWPRRTRCKEGNLAFFYDQYGYDRYDFVSQLDADHVPTSSYLIEVLRPFADPAVGYVSAPSLCDRNAAESWSARGRLYAEASLHGALQCGYNGGWAPLCIGSHYAVRTAALRQIGGLGPELAEDHSTTLMMAAAGWRGVHAVDAIAHGDGPATFADLAVQEFQWSRSLVAILLAYTPGCLGRLSGRLRFQFLFSQLWYPVFSAMMAVMIAMPIVALITARPFANVTYPAFLLRFLPLALTLIVLAYGWRRTGTFRPHDAPVLSWEAALFLLARWPWSLAGSVMAVRDRLAGGFVDFRVTPKGLRETALPPVQVLTPYVVLSFVSALPALLLDDVGEARGFYVFALINAFLYAGLVVVIVARHLKENHISAWRQPRAATVDGAMVTLAVIVASVALSWRAVDGVDSLAYGAGRLTLVATTFEVSGAGRPGGLTQRLQFRPRWTPQAELEALRID